MYQRGQRPFEQLNQIGDMSDVFEPTLTDNTGTGFDREVSDTLIDRFVDAIEVPGEVLAVGCGRGHDILSLANRSIETIGIDLCAEALTVAKARVPDAIFRRMDCRSLKYPPETFVGVWSRLSLSHSQLESVSNSLKEFAKVLKPRGVLGIRVTEDIPGDSIESALWRMIESTGFQKLGIQHSAIDRSIQVLAVRREADSNRVDTEEEFNCVLCPTARFKFNREVGLLSASSILWGDQDLYVIPDIAPLTEGHLLIATTSHHICFGDCHDSLIPKLEAIKDRVRRLFQDAYRKATLFFEHGPAKCHEGGACIEHAHWHCLPISVPIRQAIAHYFGEGYPASLKTLQNLYKNGQSYLYVEDEGSGWVYPVSMLTSQFLRQIVTMLLGKGAWRWQTGCKNPETQAVYRSTLERLLPIVDSEMI